MAEKDKEFLKRLLSTFRVEAEEHLKLMTDGLLELEKTPAAEKQMFIVENVFREAHSLKGAARAVNMPEIERLCQSLETVFAAWKRGEIAPSRPLFDRLHLALKSLGPLLMPADGKPADAPKHSTQEISRDLEEILKTAAPAAKQSASDQTAKEDPAGSYSEPSLSLAEETSASTETVRIATAKLDAILLQAEELLSVKLTTGQHVAELREINAAVARWKREWAKVQAEIGSVRRSMERSVQETGSRNGHATKIARLLDWDLGGFTEFESKLVSLERSAQQDHRALGAMVDGLLADMKQVLMLPVGSLLETFPLLVRNLSRSQAKDVALIIEGGGTEIDRRNLDEIKDPLIHLLRNSIDHGIEKPEERTAKNKPARGTIRITTRQKDSGKVEILISDDGRGIDLAKVRASALKLGIITPEEAEGLSDQETLGLVFRSGVSTSPMITDISGRGLGLAIVRDKTEKLRGSVSVESRPTIGTTFHVVLPLTMATFRGIPVRAGEHLFVLPSIQVDRAARIRKEQIKTVENKETIELDGAAVSLVALADALELPRRSPAEDSADAAEVILITQGGKRLAFLIDEVLNEQEVLMKSLGKQLSRVRNIAGATVLATRKLAPILNVSDLMQSAIKVGRGAGRPTAVVADAEKAKKKSVLVVEDSITARTLLKSILETTGYDVKTAVDGVDAFTQLRSAAFDIVVSDVEMPRMNGFDLTTRIRGDKKLSELPVVLVTALESAADRERGIDVGANAYIVKSSFDQGNLLAAIRRLL